MYGSNANDEGNGMEKEKDNQNSAHIVSATSDQKNRKDADTNFSHHQKRTTIHTINRDQRKKSGSIFDDSGNTIHVFRHLCIESRIYDDVGTVHDGIHTDQLLRDVMMSNDSEGLSHVYETWFSVSINICKIFCVLIGHDGP